MEEIVDNSDINSRFKKVFELMKEHNPEMSLDELLYAVYKESELKETFENVRKTILNACEIESC